MFIGLGLYSSAPSPRPSPRRSDGSWRPASCGDWARRLPGRSAWRWSRSLRGRGDGALDVDDHGGVPARADPRSGSRRRLSPSRPADRFLTPGSSPSECCSGPAACPRRFPAELRRPFTWASVGEASRLVVTNDETVCYTCDDLPVRVMTSFLAGSELILEDVYDYAAGSRCSSVASRCCSRSVPHPNNAAWFGRLGLTTLVAHVSGERRPRFGAFGVSFTGPPCRLLLAVYGALRVDSRMAQGLMPNQHGGNGAAAARGGHGITIIATVTDRGGALLGGLVSVPSTARSAVRRGNCRDVSIAAALISSAPSAVRPAQPAGSGWRLRRKVDRLGVVHRRLRGTAAPLDGRHERSSPWPLTHSGSGPSSGRPVKNLAAMQPPWQAS